MPDLLPRAAGTVIGLAALAGFAVLLIGSATVLVLRYRHGGLVLRRQIRWLALSAIVLPSALLLAWLCYLLGLQGPAGLVVVAGLLTVFIGMPLGTVIAVLRHDLYDIDRLVSRTVSYAVITAVLAALFAVVAFLAGLVLGHRSAAAAALPPCAAPWYSAGCGTGCSGRWTGGSTGTAPGPQPRWPGSSTGSGTAGPNRKVSRQR